MGKRLKLALRIILAVVVVLAIVLAASKIYQRLDQDPDRGAIAMADSGFDQGYSTPIYLEQGWKEYDSLWFYNTTQGSGLIPYDFFLFLEQENSQTLLRDNANMDQFRYLPQKPTFFNPDGLPVGFVRETYKDHDYVGYTCAACHTGQINYKGQAIRIDGGPAMADMTSFLSALEKSMIVAQSGDKNKRFVSKVLEHDNDYSTADEVNTDLAKWTKTIHFYNTVNHSHIKYGYARLDAFGRIYNRVLQHVINKHQVSDAMALLTLQSGERLLSDAEIDKVLEDANETIIGDEQFAQIVANLKRPKQDGYPELSLKNLLRVRNAIFNEPNAPVSYPFLWDITHSTYVQWNGLAENSGVGPLGRNAGEVIGVFGILDWTTAEPGFSLAGRVSGQSKKGQRVQFDSSIDLTNLQRIESHLRSLESPQWPEHILGKIDTIKKEQGRLIYAEHCQECHELIERDAWDRLVVAKMSSVEKIGTDVATAHNSVTYKGKSGNFENTYQGVGVGTVVIEEDAPVIQILTSATLGVVATPNKDVSFIQRWAEWAYVLVMSMADNEIKKSVKNGNYDPDTTAEPYRSLLSYKARSLNGIWATAPYLHNGSVPTLYDLLLPVRRQGEPNGIEYEYRPSEFQVGSREFLPDKVGFRYEGYKGSLFRTNRVGDMNTGHEYGAGRTAQLDGSFLPPLTEEQRWALVEYLKTL